MCHVASWTLSERALTDCEGEEAEADEDAEVSN